MSADTETMDTVGFAGDWHGTTHAAIRRLNALAGRGVQHIYQVGDFGLWPGWQGERYLADLHEVCERNDQILYIVLGNHDDHTRHASMDVHANGWKILHDYPRLWFAPRAHTWLDSNGVRFASLVGAGSIDIAFRREGVSWWREEEITEEDCAELVDKVRARKWDRVDIVLTHDAPAGLVRLGMQPPPNYLTPEIAKYCWEQRVRLRTAMDAIAPRTLVHGHWHESFRDGWEGVRTDTEEGYYCRVVGLPNESWKDNAVSAVLQAGVGIVGEPKSAF